MITVQRKCGRHGYDSDGHLLPDHVIDKKARWCIGRYPRIVSINLLGIKWLSALPYPQWEVGGVL